jgi:hypothetical protein
MPGFEVTKYLPLFFQPLNNALLTVTGDLTNIDLKISSPVAPNHAPVTTKTATNTTTKSATKTHCFAAITIINVIITGNAAAMLMPVEESEYLAKSKKLPRNKFQLSLAS